MKENLTIGVFNDIQSIGDTMVRVPGLFALRKLYPKAKIILFGVRLTKELLKNAPFIDEIVRVDELDWHRDAKKVHGLNFDDYKLDVLILASSYKFNSLLRLAAQSKTPQIIAPLRLNTLFAPRITTCFYTKTKPHREVYRTLRMVRKIDKKRFDEGVKKLDFKEAKLQTSAKNKAYIDEVFREFDAKNYQKIIGINAFGNTAYKLSAQDFLELANGLGKEHANMLFVLMNYSANAFTFRAHGGGQFENVKEFINEGDLFDLMELTSRLDLLISVDTGNVHIADNQGIAILEMIEQNVFKQWAGGSYKNTCEVLIVPTKLEKFKKNYQKIKQKFFEKAKEIVAGI